MHEAGWKPDANSRGIVVTTQSCLHGIGEDLDDRWAVEGEPLGDGVVDYATFFDVFEKKCPGVAVHIETIGGFNKDLNYFGYEFEDKR